MNPYAYRRPLRLTNADRDAWAAYEAANARAADEYEAVPLCGRTGRIMRCACGAPAIDNLCRACRKAGASS